MGFLSDLVLITKLSSILSPSIWGQVVLSLSAIAIGALLATIAFSIAKTRFLNTTEHITVTRFIRISIYNLFIFGALLSTIGISERLFHANGFVLFFVQCAYWAAITSYIWIITRQWLIPALFFAFLTALKILGHLQIFETAGQFLNKYAVSIGTLHITPLAVIKIGISLLFLIWLARNLIVFIQNQVGRLNHLHPPTRELIKKGVSIGVYTLAVLVGLNVAGIQMTALAVLGGGLGVGIGLGLQKISANFISGVIVLAEGNFKAGDLIEIEGGPGGANSGTIRRFGARYMMIESGDGREVLIPNEDFVTRRVTNWTLTHNRAQITIPIEISYGQDIVQTQQLLIAAATENPNCVSDPKPTALVTQFTERGIRIQLQLVIKDVTVGRPAIQSDVMIRAIQKLGAAGIAMAQATPEPR